MPRVPETGQFTLSSRHPVGWLASCTSNPAIRHPPGAAESFDELTDERKAAALRFLFPAVRIKASTVKGVFDFGRIDIDPSQLH